MTDFKTLTLEQAKRLIAAEQDEITQVNRKFIDGDHWQDGEGWVGPLPGIDEDGYFDAITLIKKSFISRNAISEVVERHVNGVLGKRPIWNFTPIRRLNVEEGEEPNEQEKDEIDELHSIVQNWWDKRGVHNILKDIGSNLLWSRRGPGRLYVPGALLNNGRIQVNGNNLEDALMVIFPDAPLPEDCIVYIDSLTRSEIGILYSKDEDTGKESVELVYLDNDKTIIRMIEDQTQTFTFDFGKRLTIFQSYRPLLITRQIQESQRALNLAASMVPRNVVTGGFLERVFLNAQMPGHWEKNADGSRGRFVPDELHLGPGTTNFVRGVDYDETDPVTGRIKTVVATPDVKWRAPTPVTPSVEAKDSHYKDILSEADQAHILTLDHANASGRSREQARADYVTSLWTTANTLDELGRWMIESAVSMAEQIMGRPGFYTSRYRVNFSCRIDAGPISVDEKKNNIDSIDKNAISRRTAMMLNGLDDVDSELMLIADQPDARLDLRKKQAEALKGFTDAGVELEAAARIIGMGEEDIELLLKGMKVKEEKQQEMNEQLQNEDNNNIPPQEDEENEDG